ncbi:MAG: 2-phosphosulfolactate phosphatase, partial [Thermoguttaceae bacterium]|nr:2-phosphosulfolactate phosphatase [Thermoguttaceae bacterium]
MNITLYPLPDLVEENASPDAAIFIDVLRATTTMTAALAAGAARIIPIADPQEALRLKKRSIES